ncbi:MAG: OsmC family protein [Thermoleophilia bacterium]|jgi:ribosomal protein S12 methylthiotransferase accessory factor|nr:OsmC family protein [Thermoleophilia bacterium]
MEMKVSFPGNLKVDAEFAGFTVETDQPVLAGGDGSAPAPFDLFLASLATCAGIFMLAFLKQRGLTTEDTGITMTVERDPARGMVSLVGFELHLPADFPDKYEAAIVRAVEQCSVKRHLHQPPDFKVTLSRPLPE